jgi:NAD(P)-dependent dehydrogenase (short-subunit alcohol dehydrogenase family)
MPIAVVTGASRGLGEALTRRLVDQGWSVVIDARGRDALASVTSALAAQTTDPTRIVAIDGDIADPAHRQALLSAAEELGGIDLVVNNASVLGTSPLPHLADYSLEVLRNVVGVNTLAPLALIQEALPFLRRSTNPRVLNITSDASVEPYEGWGAYGASKAALDHLTAILAVEEPDTKMWAVDPGDMRTVLHQEAFPGEDISDRPLPEASVPGLMLLIDGDFPSGRYRVSDLAVEQRAS